MADRLALFEDECGFAVSLPVSGSDIAALFEQNRTHTYLVEAPLDGASGDNAFPLTEAPEFEHGEIVSAIVARCPSSDPPQALWSRSPRYAFYIDEHDMVFHVEDHSLYLG